jgi:hypothetical protein
MADFFIGKEVITNAGAVYRELMMGDRELRRMREADCY